MKRIEPSEVYRGLPCSIVSAGCALGYATLGEISRLVAPGLRSDGYLSLRGMDGLLRANMGVKKAVTFKRGERPVLRDFAHANEGHRAVICLLGHFVYFDGHNYYSYFKNGGDEVVKAWFLD